MNVQSSFNVTATSRDPPDALQSMGEAWALGHAHRQVLGVKRDGLLRAQWVSGTLRQAGATLRRPQLWNSTLPNA